MKVKDFLAHLNNLPKEVLDHEIVLVVDDNLYLVDNLGCSAEPFYWNCDCGLIDETGMHKAIADGEPEFELSLKDFELVYPKHTVFLNASIPTAESQPQTLSDRMHEVVNLYDDNATGFEQGGIPHLKVERE